MRGKIFLIRRFLYNFGYKYRNFMIGRYGNDELNTFLLIIALVFMFMSRVPQLIFLYFVAFLILIFSCFRMYSRNISKRYEEKMKFLKLKNKFMIFYRIKSDAWKHRKTHKYFSCKNCKASIRVPRGVGKIEVTCPKCKKKVIKKV